MIRYKLVADVLFAVVKYEYQAQIGGEVHTAVVDTTYVRDDHPPPRPYHTKERDDVEQEIIEV